MNRQTARAYADMTFWGEHYGIKSPPIVSGRRSPEWARAAQRRWDAGDRRGLRVRPVLDSHHHAGTAFDLRDTGKLRQLAQLAPDAGLRWGGTFRTPDIVHFDLR